MALTEWELWACANEMVKHHGPEAPIHAAMKADELLLKGDQAGAATWRLIVHRVNELLREPSAVRH